MCSSCCCCSAAGGHLPGWVGLGSPACRVVSCPRPPTRWTLKPCRPSSFTGPTDPFRSRTRTPAGPAGGDNPLMKHFLRWAGRGWSKISLQGQGRSARSMVHTRLQAKGKGIDTEALRCGLVSATWASSLWWWWIDDQIDVVSTNPAASNYSDTTSRWTAI